MAGNVSTDISNNKSLNRRWSGELYGPIIFIVLFIIEVYSTVTTMPMMTSDKSDHYTTNQTLFSSNSGLCLHYGSSVQATDQ
ncbi:hypothetical protein V1478_012793 [Vespula squamosa]|uniref:Uncharacterized protein n=1 Tax=Vespula squamosa TaxID=30214 RepID=A0ABD2A8Y7_VESSQ